MTILDITFTEIFKIWFGFNIIPWIIGVVIFGVMCIWGLILKLK